MIARKSRTINTAKNLGIGAITQVLSLFLSFVSRTVFIHTLGNEYLSVNGLFTNILTILTFTDLGIGAAIIYSLYKPLAEDDRPQIGKLINLFAIAYRYIAISIFVLGLCLIPVLPHIVNNVPTIKENIILLYVLFLLNTVSSYIFGYKKSLLIADQKNYVVISIYTLFNILQVILQVAVLYLTHNFVAYLLIMVGITLLNNVISTTYVNRKYRWIKDVEHLKLNKTERKGIFTNIKNIVVYKFGSVILNGSDNIIISGLIRTTLVGICSNYTMLINAVTSVINQGVAGLAASIGNYNVEAGIKDNKNVFNQLSLLSYWAIGLISIIMACTFNPFIHIWLGSDYILPQSVVISLVLGFYSILINTIPSSYRTAMGFFREARFAPFIAAILNIILSVLGAKQMGLTGVFLATFISRTLTYCVIDPYYIFKKGFKANPWEYYRAFVLRLTLICIVYVVCAYIIHLIHLQGIALVIVSFFVSFTTFNIVFILIYYRNIYMQAALHKISWNIFKNR